MTKYRTLLDEERLTVIRRMIDRVKKLDGDFAELGVYRGGVARMLSELAPARHLWLYDTFEGMPPITVNGVDEHHAGDFADVSVNEVMSYVNNSNAHFVKGIFTGVPFQDSMPDKDKYCLVHLDADLYESTKCGLNYFWPRMVSGGIIVLDDYFWPGCPGVLKAVNEYFLPRLKEGYFSMQAPYQLIIEKL
jgi:hypothetical protein